MRDWQPQAMEPANDGKRPSANIGCVALFGLPFLIGGLFKEGLMLVLLGLVFSG